MLRHPRTGDCKALTLGWNWSFFLFGGFLGLPMFFKGLTAWGAAVLLCWCFDLALPFIAPSLALTAPLLLLAPMLAIAAICLFVALRGNGMIARRYIVRGYDFAKPESLEARLARQKWGLET